MTSFELNQTYQMRFIGDSELIVPVTILKRTAKTVTFKEGVQEPKRGKVHVSDEGEFIYPCGRYSMAPICRAANLYQK